MSNKPFYITTTLPYVNAEPHIGFAMEIIRADIIARAKKLAGYDVFFNTGTDEHGIKIFRKAKELGIETQTYVDGLAEKYKELHKVLNILPDANFIRTTDAHHKMAAQAFWTKVAENGYIYKKEYSIKYCVGCELEKTESELVEGKCPLHPIQELEIIQEENYFFKASAFSDKLIELYEKNPTFVVPEFRFNEIKSLLKNEGLKDFSISRLASKMPWGVPVPNDPTQVMYVWFDALVDYISAIGWPDDEVRGTKSAGAFKKWWIETGGVVQYCGKDNLRQQAAMWQSMLMAAGLPPSKTIIINGFITGEGGLKMSKSLGNTVDPLDIVKEYGTDALRYYVVKELSPFEDSPFTPEKFKESYNAGLANGIGNLTSRIMKMAANAGVLYTDHTGEAKDFHDFSYSAHYDEFNIQKVCHDIWKDITALDTYIQNEQPFKKIKENPDAGKKDIAYLLSHLLRIAVQIQPILPETSEKVQTLIKEGKMPDQPLFARK
ncbi:MAG: methionine--tRNA ligase [Candidatus Pacebacteria bacterium]|nr:methionine--tRNA ligase [Candidatus Paceibacterota bacterium]